MICYLDYEDAKKIVYILGNLPLAIDQAGVYLNKLAKPLASFVPLFEANFNSTLSKKPPVALWQYESCISDRLDSSLRLTAALTDAYRSAQSSRTDLDDRINSIQAAQVLLDTLSSKLESRMTRLTDIENSLAIIDKQITESACSLSTTLSPAMLKKHLDSLREVETGLRQQMKRASVARVAEHLEKLRVAKGMANTSLEGDKNRKEFLKVEEGRIGRELHMLAGMLSGVGWEILRDCEGESTVEGDGKRNRVSEA